MVDVNRRAAAFHGNDLDAASAQRFWSRVDRGGPDQCWPWLGGKARGYGSYFFKKKHRPAHRVAYEIVNGPVPDGLFVCHRCDNRPCCNPNHLFVGTQSENLRDCSAKGRTAQQRGIGVCAGERNGRSKLTDEKVREIRALVAQGKPKKTVARAYGVSDTVVRHIVQGVRWKAIA